MHIYGSNFYGVESAGVGRGATFGGVSALRRTYAVLSRTHHRLRSTWEYGRQGAGAPAVHAVAGVTPDTAADDFTYDAATVQQNDPKINYLGDWSTAISSSALGGSFASTGQTGALAVVRFTGTDIKGVFPATPWCGQAEVTLTRAWQVNRWTSSISIVHGKPGM